jgi:ornithine cyclodeaminase/alanine dehydrogenase-like protein (mu-crystallin family)
VFSNNAKPERGADIVNTVTTGKTLFTVRKPEMIKPGVHLNTRGVNCPSETGQGDAILDPASEFVAREPPSGMEGERQHRPAALPDTEHALGERIEPIPRLDDPDHLFVYRVAPSRATTPRGD